MGGNGRTVEILLRPNTKRNHKEQHITQSLLYRWKLGGTVEKYSKTPNERGITKEQHHSIPAFIGRNW
jgi:hypothetical protein